MSGRYRRIAPFDAFNADILQHHIRSAWIIVHVDSIARIERIAQVIRIGIPDVDAFDVNLARGASARNIDSMARRTGIGTWNRHVNFASNDLQDRKSTRL